MLYSINISIDTDDNSLIATMNSDLNTVFVADETNIDATELYNKILELLEKEV